MHITRVLAGCSNSLLLHTHKHTHTYMHTCTLMHACTHTHLRTKCTSTCTQRHTSIPIHSLIYIQYSNKANLKPHTYSTYNNWETQKRCTRYTRAHAKGTINWLWSDSLNTLKSSGKKTGLSKFTSDQLIQSLAASTEEVLMHCMDRPVCHWEKWSGQLFPDLKHT